MDDYIKRSIAIEKLTSECDYLTEYGRHYVDATKHMLENIEAADVAEVVRCKDCNQWKRNYGFVDSPNGHCFYHSIDTNGYDFCSYGVIKMDGDRVT